MDRRRFLLMTAAVAATGLPRDTFAAQQDGSGSWDGFITAMERLAAAHHAGRASAERVAADGQGMLRGLDIQSPGFLHAVADSYESGNRFWLWNRLAKQSRLLGGILTIEAEPVPLHDHPGAVGMVRVLSGEAKVWQFDPVAVPDDTGVVTLKRTLAATLRPGDQGVLLPNKGNIHALQATTTECRMLDFFIPPYRRAQRHWFTPLDADWQDRDTVSCRAIGEFDYDAT